jgi:ABC-type molybdate transport system permease subunit
MMTEIWWITLLTVAMATAATALILPVGLLLAWALARGRFRGRVLLETIVSLPLVMPPVATGLVLLMLLAPRGVLGPALATAGIEIVFTWKAAVIAMAVMGLPLLVRTARAGFEQVDHRYESVAATLGASSPRVPHRDTAAGDAGGRSRPRSRLRARDRRVRRDDDDCREHPRIDANAGGGDLLVRGNRP